jgi:hypothetical protein
MFFLRICLISDDGSNRIGQRAPEAEDATSAQTWLLLGVPGAGLGCAKVMSYS